MKPRATFFVTSFGALFGTFASAIAIGALGYRDTRVAGLLGGALGLLLTVSAATRLGWVAPDLRDKALRSGVVGLLLAWVITMVTISTMIIPILSFALVGAGVLHGTGHLRESSTTDTTDT